MDVGDWLRSLGLGQYEALFRENDIDAEVLNDLSDGDLKNSACHSAIASDCSRRLQIWPQRNPAPTRRH
jgi:hypothetical protein